MTLDSLNMMIKVLLVTTFCVVLLPQNILSARPKYERIQEHGIRSYVQIENATYYLDTMTGFWRPGAQAACEALNMTLVTFETEEKWLGIKEWLGNSVYPVNYFWTGAMRDSGSSTWYWEKSGAVISKFFWGVDQPALSDITTDAACIDFSYVVGGWEDDSCYTHYLLDAMCE